MDPLAGLRDIRLPAEPDWWPPAPGWWVLVAIAGAILIAAGWYAWRVFKRGRAARAARRALDAIEADYAADADQARATRRISALLRRYLLARFDRATVAGLAGGAWADFVHQQVGGDPCRASALATAPYRPNGGNVGEMLAMARSLIHATTRRRPRAVHDGPRP